MTPIESISEAITALEAQRDYGEINAQQDETLAVLNMCYDLLTRTNEISSIRVKQFDEMKDFDNDHEYINKYGISSSALADFVFALITRTGSVSLRKVLAQLVWGEITLKEIEAKTGVYRSNLSKYLNEKGEIQTDTWERITNAFLVQ